MRALIFALLAMCSYAAQNVILDARLKELSPFTLVTIVSGTVFGLSIIMLMMRSASGVPIDVPNKHQLIFALSAGMLLFFADLCFFGAYNSGAKMSMMTTMPIILPVLAMMIAFVTVGTDAPSRMALGGWVLAALSVWLLSKDM